MSERNIYSYIVDHENETPSVGIRTEVNGGTVIGVMFDDALKKLEDVDEFITGLRDSTKCDQTKYAIDDFLN